MKIIVVDDKEEERYLSQTLLKGSGYEVETAANGAEALEKLRAEGFGMIVSDVLMPVMDGFRLCRECKEDEKLKDIPFIFYTATYKDERDEELASKVGADRFIRKPVEPEEFVKIIQGVFRDIEEGKIGPKRRVLEEEREVLKLYSKRLIEKLEKKMLDLEAEITERKHAEEELTREKERTEEYLNIAGVMLSIVSADENITLMNNRGCETLGYKEEELIGKNWFDTLVPQSIREKVRSVFRTLMTGDIEPVEYYENPLLTKDGEERLITFHNTVIRERNGTIVGVLTSGEDITERKRAEEKLQESEERFRALIENSLDIIQIVDSEGVIRYVSPSVERILGYKPEEVTGRLSVDFVHPDDLPIVTKGFEEAIHAPNIPVITECRCKHKDGTWRVILGIGVNRLDIPSIKGFISNMHDVTERKRAEEKIKRAAEEWRTTFDAITDLVFITDKSFRLLRVNKAFADIVKKKPAELIGKPCYEIVHGTNEPIADCPHKKTIKTKEPAAAEFFEPHLGIHLEVSTSPIFNDKGEVVDSVHIVTDITERKQAEAKTRELQVLREVDNLRSQLLANISHELRTPLTSIKGFTSTLLRTDVEWSEEEQRDYLQTIDQESDRLIHLISDLLDMSRLDAGALKLEKDNYHISEILDSVSSRLATLTERHQLQVIIPSGSPSVFVDQMRIGQVLTNLVENATKYSGEGSLITIEAQLAGDQIVVSVTDRGQGIATELLDRVFDRFYQTESVATGRKSGTGLGLSICKSIIEAHGGSLRMESKLEEGSKFSFSLPVGKGE